MKLFLSVLKSKFLCRSVTRAGAITNHSIMSNLVAKRVTLQSSYQYLYFLENPKGNVELELSSWREYAQQYISIGQQSSFYWVPCWSNFWNQVRRKNIINDLSVFRNYTRVHTPNNKPIFFNCVHITNWLKTIMLVRMIWQDLLKTPNKNGRTKCTVFRNGLGLTKQSFLWHLRYPGKPQNVYLNQRSIIF